jgi:hypothetical protein
MFEIMKTIYRMLKGKKYYFYIEGALLNCNSVLDMGCGNDSPIKKLSRNFYSVGFDGFKPSIMESKKKGIHNEYVLGDLAHPCFQPRSFDAVIALDVIEHITKLSGYNLLMNMERTAIIKTVIFTPSGFLPQDECEGNEYQRHVSGWTPKELKNWGFEVVGVNGVKFLWKERAMFRFWGPEFLWAEIIALTQKITFHFPAIAFEILAIKNLNKK